MLNLLGRPEGCGRLVDPGAERCRMQLSQNLCQLKCPSMYGFYGVQDKYLGLSALLLLKHNRRLIFDFLGGDALCSLVVRLRNVASHKRRSWTIQALRLGHGLRWRNLSLVVQGQASKAAALVSCSRTKNSPHT